MKKKSAMIIVLVSTTILIIVPFIIGSFLPRNHQAIVVANINAPRETVFAFAVNIDEWPNWRSDVDAVEHFADETYRATVIGSGDKIDYEFSGDFESFVMVARIVSTELPFGGQWTIAVESDGPDASRLSVVEEGFVDSPVWRFVSRFIIGHKRTAQIYVDEVRERCGGGVCLVTN